MASSNALPYSRYDEWVEAGEPYYIGVNLFAQLDIMPVLRRNFTNQGPTAYNVKVLRGELKKHYSNVPPTLARQEALAVTPAATAPEAKSEPPASAPPPDAITPSRAFRLQLSGMPVQAMKQAEALSTKEEPAMHATLLSESRIQAIPFQNLPPVLQKSRIAAIEMDRERARLHAQLLPSKPGQPCIHFRDMLRLMDERDPATQQPRRFTIKRVTYNRRTREGGELVTHERCMLLTENALPNPRSFTERHESRKAKANSNARHKPGDHWRMATRNLVNSDDTIEKCIIWLIVEFNGMRVVLHSNVPAPKDVARTIEDRLPLARRIIELSDSYARHWDAERLFEHHGVAPFVPEEFSVQVKGMTDEQLRAYGLNKLNPRISRAHKGIRRNAGVKQVEWSSKLKEALLQRDIINTELAARTSAREATATQVLADKAPPPPAAPKKKVRRKQRRVRRRAANRDRS